MILFFWIFESKMTTTKTTIDSQLDKETIREMGSTVILRHLYLFSPREIQEIIMANPKDYEGNIPDLVLGLYGIRNNPLEGKKGSSLVLGMLFGVPAIYLEKYGKINVKLEYHEIFKKYQSGANVCLSDFVKFVNHDSHPMLTNLVRATFSTEELIAMKSPLITKVLEDAFELQKILSF